MADREPFNDPVVRCTQCMDIIERMTLRKIGMCPRCGCRKVKEILTLTKEEINWLNKKKYTDFTSQFKQEED